MAKPKFITDRKELEKLAPMLIAPIKRQVFVCNGKSCSQVGSAEVKAGLANSKFKNAAGFGDKIKGHILLTNHHDETWFRNMRLRELPAK